MFLFEYRSEVKHTMSVNFIEVVKTSKGYIPTIGATIEEGGTIKSFKDPRNDFTYHLIKRSDTTEGFRISVTNPNGVENIDKLDNEIFMIGGLTTKSLQIAEDVLRELNRIDSEYNMKFTEGQLLNAIDVAIAKRLI